MRQVNLAELQASEQPLKITLMLLGIPVEISKNMAQNSLNFYFKKHENLQNQSVLDVRPIMRSGMSQSFQRTPI